MGLDDEEVESDVIHTHDRLTGTPLSAGGGGGGGTGSWACHLLRRGWDLTQKAAIAGAAVTAAPVVAPPLIVLSAAGVALSVPFAAYLASLAATNHLMDALLRSCYPPPQPYYHQQFLEDDDVEQEFLDASEEYCQWAPAFSHLDTGTEREEEDEGEGETSLLLLLPRHLDFSEASSAADAEEAEVEGELSARESYTSDRGDETEEHTPVEGKEGLPRGFGVSASAMPLFSDEDSQVQKKGEGGFPVLDSGQQSFQSENWTEKEHGVYSTNREEDVNMEGDKSTQNKLYFPEPYVPPSGDDEIVVQEKEEGEFSVQRSGQQSFQSKNRNQKDEDDVKTTEENKSTNETPSQGFYFPELRVPASIDKDNEVQERGEGEFSAHILGQYSLLSNIGDKNEQGMTAEEKKSTEDIPLRDFVVSESSVPVLHGEDDVVQSKEGFEVAVLGVVEDDNSNTDVVIGEAADVQPEITAIAAPESEVLPPSNLLAHESPVDLVTEEIVDVDIDIAAAVEPESEMLHPTSESLADPITGESVDVQLEIVSTAVPESEVLPPSSFVAHESPPAVVTGEVIDVYVGTVIAAEPESDMMHPTSESTADPVNGESVDLQVVMVGAAMPGSEVLPLSSLAACESQAVAETEHVGEAMEIVRDFGDVGKEKDANTTDGNKSKSTKETVSQGFCFPESCVPSFVDNDNVVQVKREGEFSAQNLGQYSHLSNTRDKSEQGMAIEEQKSTEEIPPLDFIVSESPASVFHGEDDVVQSKEGFEVVVQELMEEANSATDPVMGEVADVQVEIIAIAAPETESEVQPASNVVARESPAGLVSGEVIDVCIRIAAAVEPETGVLHRSNLATSEAPPNPVTGEIVDVQVDIVAAAAPGSEVLPLSSLAACESQAVAETASEVTGITVTEDIVRDFGDVNKEGVSFVPVHDDEDVIMSSGSTPRLSTVEEEMIDQTNESTGVGYAVTNEAFGSRDIAEGEAHYTEEQLREQLDTIRTITGYDAVPSPTLEGELAGLYIFVGVEPAVASSDTSDRLMELNAKLRFLKSIIGVD